VFGAAAAKRGRTRSCQASDHAPERASAPTCGESDLPSRVTDVLTVGVKQVDEHIWLVIFMHYDLGYYQALAGVGLAALQAVVTEITVNAASAAELFGPGFNPATSTPRGRQQQFLSFADRNPWNNGQKDILFLSHRNNTLGALFNLLGHCGVEKAQLPVNAVCDSVGGFCGANRITILRHSATVEVLSRPQSPPARLPPHLHPVTDSSQRRGVRPPRCARATFLMASRLPAMPPPDR